MSGRPTLLWLSASWVSLPTGFDWLGPPELAVLASLRFPKRRTDWLLGRWTAKRVVHASLDPPAPSLSEIEVHAAPDGAPEVFIRGVPGNLELSISHSNSMSLCVVAPIGSSPGCDIERIEVRPPFLLSDYFLDEEVRYVSERAPAERAAYETLVWSAKESALKSLRSGLRRDTRSVVFHAGAGESAAGWRPFVVDCVETGRRFFGWWRTRDDFVLTITSNARAATHRELE